MKHPGRSRDTSHVVKAVPLNITLDLFNHDILELLLNLLPRVLVHMILLELGLELLGHFKALYCIQGVTLVAMQLVFVVFGGGKAGLSLLCEACLHLAFSELGRTSCCLMFSGWFFETPEALGFEHVGVMHDGAVGG